MSTFISRADFAAFLRENLERQFDPGNCHTCPLAEATGCEVCTGYYSMPGGTHGVRYAPLPEWAERFVDAFDADGCATHWAKLTGADALALLEKIR